MKVTFRSNINIKATQTPVVAGTPATVRFIKVMSSVVPGAERDAMEVTIAEGTELAPGVVADENLVFKTGKFRLFFKAPTMRTIERWNDTGVAKTVTGKRTECDGYGPDGSPSWMLALGMI